MQSPKMSVKTNQLNTISHKNELDWEEYEAITK
ncbi:hypothetical protein SAMN04489864_11020 [Pedobacter insulae]|uniref:Uncharacterized protein n=1 Tax=Pedobacter insulae TaxID=414048 RepID=A0A1I2ZH99_9SPHI|nr:hypothetical protein SAMN04489864_11020 [Pedobacter insulae]